jgi:putative flippase GtrA
MTLRARARALLVRRREQILYIVVGGWNTLFGYGVFALLYHLLHDVAAVPKIPGSMAALIVASVIGMANNFVLYRTIVFRSHGAVRRELPRFLVVYLAALVVNLVALPLALHELPFSAYAVQAVYTVVVVVTTYIANKYFSFAPKRRDARGARAPNGSTSESR